MSDDSHMNPGADPALTDRSLGGLEGEELIERGRDIAAERLARRELVGEAVAAAGFVACAAAMALLLSADRSLSLPLAALLVAAHVVAARIKFEVGAGFTVPTQLVLVPMLFLLPTPLVPLFVALGNLLGDLPDHLRGTRHRERTVHRAGRFLVLARSRGRARGARRADPGDRQTGRSTSWRWRRRAESTSSSRRAASGTSWGATRASWYPTGPGSARWTRCSRRSPCWPCSTPSVTVSRC